MARTSARWKRPRWLVPILLWSTIVGAALALGAYAEPPEGPNGRGTTRAVPRTPPPPLNFPNLLYQLGVGSVVWNATVIALPIMVWGARRLDIDRHGPVRTVGVSAGVVLSLITVTASADYAVLYHGAAFRPPPASFVMVALRQTVLPWVALAAIVAAVEWRRRAVQSAMERERLRAGIAEQRLIALTAQLQPHFLFNTLQGISTLIHRDPDAADEMLAKLADLLRDALRYRDRVLVPLQDELRYARTYLEIAQVRFGDRLAFRIDVASELQHGLVPLFILQPLVENALTHGIGARLCGGRVTLAARREADRLCIQVIDDGGGLPAGAIPRVGIGLSNTRERLRASFGDDFTFSLEPATGGGAIAQLDIPYTANQSPRVSE